MLTSAIAVLPVCTLCRVIGWNHWPKPYLSYSPTTRGPSAQRAPGHPSLPPYWLQQSCQVTYVQRIQGCPSLHPLRLHPTSAYCAQKASRCPGLSPHQFQLSCKGVICKESPRIYPSPCSLQVWLFHHGHPSTECPRIPAHARHRSR